MTLRSLAALRALRALVAVVAFLAWAAPGYARSVPVYNGPGMRIFPGPESENVPTDIARTATVTELVSALDEWPASTLGVVALPSSGSGGSPDATTSPDAPNPN